MALAHKIAGAPYGVAAELVREVSAPDQDGRSWHFNVSDARSPTRRLKATVSGSEATKLKPGTLEDADALEQAVEAAAPRYTTGGRLDGSMPQDVILRLGDFF